MSALSSRRSGGGEVKELINILRLVQLSEDPNVTVLLIEAGDADTKQMMSRIPAGWVRSSLCPKTLITDWSFVFFRQTSLSLWLLVRFHHPAPLTRPPSPQDTGRLGVRDDGTEGSWTPPDVPAEGKDAWWLLLYQVCPAGLFARGATGEG